MPFVLVHSHPLNTVLNADHCTMSLLLWLLGYLRHLPPPSFSPPNNTFAPFRRLVASSLSTRDVRVRSHNSYLECVRPRKRDGYRLRSHGAVAERAHDGTRHHSTHLTVRDTEVGLESTCLQQSGQTSYPRRRQTRILRERRRTTSRFLTEKEPRVETRYAPLHKSRRRIFKC